jgi:hypothetical protein
MIGNLIPLSVKFLSRPKFEGMFKEIHRKQKSHKRGLSCCSVGAEWRLGYTFSLQDTSQRDQGASLNSPVVSVWMLSDPLSSMLLSLID